MLKVDVSDISGPIAGYLVSSIIMFVSGIYILNGKTGVFDVDDCTFAIAVLGFVLLICAYMSLKQSYLTDGLTFILESVVVLSISVGYMIHEYVFGDILHIVMAIAFLLVAYMSFIILDDVNVAINILWAILMIVSLNILENMVYVISAVCILAGLCALKMFHDDWTAVRNMDADYESRISRRKDREQSSSEEDSNL